MKQTRPLRVQQRDGYPNTDVESPTRISCMPILMVSVGMYLAAKEI